MPYKFLVCSADISIKT